MLQYLDASPRFDAKRGFNLIEAAIVLGIIGLVIGGIWQAAAAISNKRYITSITNGIYTVNANIRNLYRGMPIAIPYQIQNMPGGSETAAIMGLFSGTDSFSWRIIPSVGNYILDQRNISYSIRIDGTGYPQEIVWDVAYPDTATCMNFIAQLTASAAGKGTFGNGTQSELVAVVINSNYYDSFPLFPPAADCAPGNSIQMGFRW